MEENKIQTKEIKSQIIKKEDLEQNENKGIYLRDDHCEWGTSGMTQLIKTLKDSN